MQIYTRQVEVSGAMPIPGIYYQNFHDLLMSDSPPPPPPQSPQVDNNLTRWNELNFLELLLYLVV